MSLANYPPQLFHQVPEEYDLSENFFGVQSVPQTVINKTFTTQSANNSSINISCNPPGAGALVSPVMWKEVQLSLTVTHNIQLSNTADTYFIPNLSGNHSPFYPTLAEAENAYLGILNGQNEKAFIGRSFPLNKIIITENVAINSQTLNTPLRDYEAAFSRVNNNFMDRAGEYSLTPSQLDRFHSYAFMNNTMKDPFANYIDSGLDESRAAFRRYEYSDVAISGTGMILTQPNAGVHVYKIANTNTPTNVLSYKIKMTVMEPVFVSPFFMQKKAIPYVETIDYSATLGNLERAFCAKTLTNGLLLLTTSTDGSVAMGNFVVTAATLESANIHATFMIPKDINDIPPAVGLDYQEIKISKSNNSNSLLYDESQTLDLTAVSLSSVPRRLVIWAEETQNSRTGFTTGLLKTDSIKSRIERINLQFGGNYVLTSATEQDLYSISRENGYDGTYSQYSEYDGSVLVLDMDNIGLPLSWAPGVVQKPQFSVSATIKCVDPNSEGVVFNLKCAIIYAGRFDMLGTTAAYRVGIMTSEDVAQTLLDGKMVVESKMPVNKFGGKIGGKIGGFNLAALLPIAQAVRKGVQMVSPIVKQGADLAEKLGLGQQQGGASMKMKDLFQKVRPK